MKFDVEKILRENPGVEIYCVPFEYPADCDTPEKKRAWESRLIASGVALPPARVLPEGSLLHEEVLRREADALRYHREQMALRAAQRAAQAQETRQKTGEGGE